MVDITDVMDEDCANPPPPHIAEGIEEGNFPPQDAWGGGKQSTDDRSRELFDDADDIEGAMEHAIRPSARLRLKNVITKLREEGEALLAKRANANAAAAADDPASSSSADPTPAATTPTVEDVKAARLPPYEPAAPVPKLSPAPNVVITSSSVKYRNFPTIQFDAGGYNSPTVTVYLPLDGIGKHDRTKISCQFTSGSFDLIVSDFEEGGANYRLLNDNLEHEIDVSQSKYVIKPNKIIIKLGKVKSGTEKWSSYDSWTQLSSKKSKDKNATGGKKKDDPMGGIMDMMKDMYESGDDNMKKVIGEAMYKQRMGQKPEDMMGGGAGGGMDMDGF